MGSAGGSDLRSASVPAHVTWHDAGGDLVVFNGRDGTYHAFDRIGSDIWRALARGARVSVVAAELGHHYEGDAGVITEDVAWFIERAADLGLLVVS